MIKSDPLDGMLDLQGEGPTAETIEWNEHEHVTCVDPDASEFIPLTVSHYEDVLAGS